MAILPYFIKSSHFYPCKLIVTYDNYSALKEFSSIFLFFAQYIYLKTAIMDNSYKLRVFSFNVLHEGFLLQGKFLNTAIHR